jgi:methyl-accepting chemotaxis protein
MKILAKLPVRSKFNVMLGVVALGFAAASGVGFYATNDLAASALEIQAWDVERLGLWSALDTTMLEVRRDEKDFLLRAPRRSEFFQTNRAKELDLHTEGLKHLRRKAKEARTLYERFGRQGQIDFDTFEGHIDAYDAHFAKLERATYDRGDLDHGLIGECRRIELELEHLVEGKSDLIIALAQCRSAERSFYLRRDIKTRDAFLDELARVRPLLQPVAGAPAALDRYVQTFNAVAALDAQAGWTENDGYQGAARDAIHAFEGIVRPEMERVFKERAATAEKIRETRQHLMIFLGSMSLALLAGVFFLGQTIAGGIRASVESLRGRVSELRSGNLDIGFPTVPSSEDDLDLLCADMGQLAGVLRTFVAASQTTSRTIDSSVNDVQRALTELASGYQQQSSAVSQTVTTLDELRSSAVSGNDRAREVLEQAKQVTAIAQKGSTAVGDVTDGMRTIRSQVEQIATSVLDLSERAQRIGEIVDSVNAIADQSKLLALNASIEAAKAGEYGHGFAVVAEEVRALAERSQSATREIATILKEIQKATNASVMATEDGSKSVAKGLELVNTSRETIRTLSDTIESSSKAVEQITYSVTQQTAGVTQINEAMNGILSAVQQGTAESSRIKETMVEVAGRVSELQQVVGKFRWAQS